MTGRPKGSEQVWRVATQTLFEGDRGVAAEPVRCSTVAYWRDLENSGWAKRGYLRGVAGNM